MDFDAKSKIELHGASIKKELMFSITRILGLILVVAIVLRGRPSTAILVLALLYAAVGIRGTLKKIEKHKMFYTFAPGNPVYDQLTEYGNPDEILSAINEQARSGKVIYEALCGPTCTKPETLITDDFLLHLNKRATIIPLDKIVCAYVYDHLTGETPDERQAPSRFKPLYFIIIYGRERQAVFMYRSIDYKKVLGLLDEKLGCAVKFTREMGELYKTDYDSFLKKAAEEKKAHENSPHREARA